MSITAKGVVRLDVYSFDKVVSRFPVSLVRFDTPYPFGEKAEEYDKVAKELSSTNDLLISDVGVEEFGDKFNLDLAQKFGIEGKDDLPRIFLFKKNSLDKPVTFSGDWNAGNIKSFIRSNSNLRLLLEGCVEQLDDLAEKFVAAKDKDSRENVMKEATKVIEELKESKDKTSGDIYIKLMQKVLERGDKFLLSELERVKNLLSGGKMNDAKKKNLQQRVNIIQSFLPQTSEETTADSKTEL